MFKQLGLQKYCMKYEYTELELLETKLLFDEYKNSFVEEYYKLIPKQEQPKQEEGKQEEPQQEEGKQEHPKQEEGKQEAKEEPQQEAKEQPKQNVTLKRLYRKLSLLTHPDKQTGTDELFKIIKEAYDTDNYLKLTTLAVKFKIEIEEDIDVKCWDEEIDKMNKKIQEYKNSFAWLWKNVSNETEKQKLIEKIKLYKDKKNIVF